MPEAALRGRGTVSPVAVREVAAGLRRPQPELPPKFFYDERGSRLFERITRLSEYYLTRAERALLERWMPDWMAGAAPGAVVELGAGSGEKTRIVLEAVLAASGSARYVPVDVSADFLAASASAIARSYPALDVQPLVADLADPFPLPVGLPGPVLHAFLGSTLGNFEPEPAVDLLRRVRARMGAGDRFLLGVDLRKDPAVIEAAYDDHAGITAEFNLNMLRVVNARAGADFDPSQWEHRSFYHRELHRVEMHLVARAEQAVSLPGGSRFRFAAGETIRTEISVKHDRPGVEAMLEAAGMRLERWEAGEDDLYAIALAGPV
jgi:L-histidine Nalpha-methyltransferase